MTKRVFVFLAAAILLVSFILRIVPLSQNNFYFTVDQGRDAVVVRQILMEHKLVARGPETTIKGIYTGPLWYYFLALGYLVTGGDPRGGVLVVVLLNILALGCVMWLVGKRVGRREAIVVGLGLSVFWPFYESSAWAFNPFPLVFLGFLLVYEISRFVEGDRRALVWAVGVAFLGANANLAGAAAFFLTTLAVGIWGVLRKRVKVRRFLLLFFLPVVLILLVNGLTFPATLVRSLGVGQAGGLGIFSGNQFLPLAREFLMIVGRAALPQFLWVGLGVFLVVSLFAWRSLQRKKNSFRRHFVVLVFLVFIVSFVFFGASRGWRDWQSVYLAPLVFTAFLLMVLALRKRPVFRLLVILILVSQWLFLGGKYFGYPGRSDDPGILANQLRVIDWIYQKSEGQGFAVYTYTKGYYDFPEQYLFWWYGRGKYGYVPCEYANLPGTDKGEYVPGESFYGVPKKDCTRRQFLIVKDPTNGEKNADWIDEYRAVTKLVESAQLGGVRVEERELTDVSNVLFDTNVDLSDFWKEALHLKLPNGWARQEENGMIVSEFAGGNFKLGALTNKKGCLGGSLDVFSKLISDLEGGRVSMKREEDLSGTAVYRVDLVLADGKSAFSAALFRGGINDYFVGVYRRGPFLGARKLTERLLAGVRVVEDEGTRPVEECALRGQ